MSQKIRHQKMLGLSKMVSYGNRSDVDEADMIWYLASD
ncbi:MAG: hypothetical protein EXS76_02590 [Nitrosarchaeum sp.]|nr:hypothetical protein [Nitrosarchaeum sp.]